MTDPAAAVAAPEALTVLDISYRFPGRLALDGVSIAVAPHQFGMLLGVNGAGKTTLFSLITGLYSYRVGSIRIYGHELRTRARRALAQIGVVFQQPTLDLDLTVAQNLHYHAALHGLPRGLAKARIAESLERSELSDRIGDKVRGLSGGQRRRVELARALLHRPRLLLLDEPSVGLDIHSRRAILEHVRSLCRDEGLGVLWATHLIDEVETGDHLVVLHEGKVRASGAVPEILASTGARTVEQAFTALTRRAAA